MKLKLLLCILAICCTIQVSCAETTLIGAKKTLQTLKDNVRSTMAVFKCKKTSMDEDVVWSLAYTRNVSMESLKKSINMGLEQLNSQIGIGKSKGAGEDEIKRCYSKAKEGIANVDYDRYASFEKCERDSLDAIDNAIKKLDDARAIGKELLKELDSILPNCFLNGGGRMPCVDKKLQSATNSVSEYSKKLPSLQNEIRKNLDEAHHTGDVCMESYMDKAIGEVKELIDNNLKCLTHN